MALPYKGRNGSSEREVERGREKQRVKWSGIYGALKARWEEASEKTQAINRMDSQIALKPLRINKEEMSAKVGDASD